MSRRSPLAATLLLAFLAFLAACGAPAESAVVLTTQPSAPASVQPTPAGSASSGVTELERTGDALAPGRYTRADFVPTITFEISDGEWYAEQMYSGFFDVQQDVGSPDVIAVQFARPSSVFGEGGSSVTVTTAAHASDVLRGHPGVTVLGASDGQMSGHEGFVVEVEHGGDSATNVSLMIVPPGPLSIAPGRRLWVAFLDTEDGLLAVMVGGSVAKWNEALAAAEPVLESLTIGD